MPYQLYSSYVRRTHSQVPQIHILYISCLNSVSSCVRALTTNIISDKNRLCDSKRVSLVSIVSWIPQTGQGFQHKLHNAQLDFSNCHLQLGHLTSVKAQTGLRANSRFLLDYQACRNGVAKVVCGMYLNIATDKIKWKKGCGFQGCFNYNIILGVEMPKLPIASFVCRSSNVSCQNAKLN